MGSGLIIIEQLIGNGIGPMFGNPLFIGVIFLAFFLAFVFLQGGRLDAKVVVIVPIMFLSLMFIPQLIIIYGISIAALLFLGLTRLLNR